MLAVPSAWASTGSISGTLTCPAGFPAGSTVTVFASTDMFRMDTFTMASYVSTGGTTLEYSMQVPAPNDFMVGALAGDMQVQPTPATALGIYQDYAKAPVSEGGSVSGIDFSLALDNEPPAAAFTFPVAGSTITALSTVAGTTSDNIGAEPSADMAAQDLTSGKWWDPRARVWIATTATPLYGGVGLDASGKPSAFSWTADLSTGAGGGWQLGGLAGYLAHGRQYRLHIRARDFVTLAQDPPSTVDFTWAGPTAETLLPGTPSNLNGSALGTSSMAWTWDLVAGAAGYTVHESSEGPRVAAVSTNSYVSMGLSTNTNYSACVSASNEYGESARTCLPYTLATLAAVPGKPAADMTGIDRVNWAWEANGNPAVQTLYALYLSTDDFETLLSTSPFETVLTEALSTGLDAGTTYFAMVRAFNRDQVPTDFSQTGSTATWPRPPEPPRDLAADIDLPARSVSLTWRPASTGTPAVSFNVYRSTAGEPGSFQLIRMTAGTSHLDSLSQPGTYYYQVSGTNDHGLEGAPSGTVWVSIPAPPDPPINAAAVLDIPNRAVALSWEPAATGVPAVSFNIYRSLGNEGGPFQLVYSTSGLSLIDSLSQSGTYYYRVAGVNIASLEGAPSAGVILAADFFAPAPIQDLRVVSSYPDRLEAELAWTASQDDFSGVARYILYVSSTGGFDAETSSYTIPSSVSLGATVAFTVAGSATQAFYAMVLSQDRAGNISGPSNNVVLDFVPPHIAAIDLAPGSIISRPRAVTADATDNVAIVQVALLVDGVPAGAPAAWPSSIIFDVSAFSDGPHTLAVRATDAGGNSATASVPVMVNYFPPASPVITSPAQNFTTSSAVIMAAGTAEPGVKVDVFVNGVAAGGATASSQGQFTLAAVFLPAEGAVLLTAAASDRRGSSPPASPINVILDFGPPGVPQYPTAQALGSGRILLTWLPPSGEVPAFYRVYRSTQETGLAPGSAPSLALRAADVGAEEFTDSTPEDGLYFYGITAVDAAMNEGVLSEAAPAVADRAAPSASILLPQSVAPLVPGLHLVHLSLSEVLATPPILTFTPEGRTPALVGLSAMEPALWQGTVTVAASINSDRAAFTFQGSDFVGNVGTDVIEGGTVALHTRGPAGTVALSSGLAAAGTQDISLSLDEPAVTTPTLSVTPFGQPAIPIGLVSAGSGNLWTGSLSITAGTGDGQANIGYWAQDSAGNISTALSGGATFFVIDTAPPAAPRDFEALARPGGVIELGWSAPSGERPARYFVYRDGARLTSVAPAVDASAGFLDSPTEARHSYEVTAVDWAGNEGPPTSAASATADRTLPAAPFDLAASTKTVDGRDVIELGWAPGLGEAASLFRVFRATSPIVGTAGPAFQAAFPPFLDLPAEDGLYYYAVTAKDAAGNESGLSNQFDILFENAAPRIELTGVSDGGFYRQDVFPSFQAFDLNLDAGSLAASLDGAPFTSGSGVSAEGAHTLLVGAADTGGHASQRTVAFTIDKTPPRIALSGVEEGSLLHSSFSAVIAVTDLSPFTTGHVLENLTLQTAAAFSSGDRVDVDGSYVLLASATDRAGNTATRSVSFVLDSAPREPKDLSIRVEEGAGADLSWTKPESDVLAYRVYRDGNRISSSLEPALTFRDPGYSADAAHVYEVAAVDRVGQAGPRARVTVPPIGVSLAGYGISLDGQEALTRGFADTIRVSLINKDSQARILGPTVLELSANGQAAGRAEASDSSVDSGGSREVSAAVWVSTGLGAQASLKVSVRLPSEDGTSAVLVKSMALSVRDPVGPVVEAFAESLIRGALAKVRVRFNNRGSAPLEVKTAVAEGLTPTATDEVTASLKTLEGMVLSQAGLAQTGNGVVGRVENDKLTYYAVIEPGTGFLFDPVEVAVPESAGASLKVEGRVRGFTGVQSQAAVSMASYTCPGLGVTLGLDVKTRPYAKTAEVGMGTEYSLGSNLALRAGYASSHGAMSGSTKANDLAGLAAGFGVKAYGIGLDYSMTPFGGLGNSHRISLGARF